METIEWTTGIVIAVSGVAAALCAVLGYLLAISFNVKKVTKLGLQLQQAEESLTQAYVMKQKQIDDLNQLSINLHEKELSESKLQSQLSNAETTEKRLDDTLAEQKADFVKLKEVHEKILALHHQAEKKLESASADLRAQKEQNEDLRNRLEISDEYVQKERDLVSQLKKDLAEEGKRAEGLSQTLDEARIHFRDKNENLNELKVENNSLLQQLRQLESEHSQLRTTLQKREEHFQEQMQQLSETKQSLTKEFENLANKIFEEKGKTFTHTSQASIDTVLKPFREQVEGFQKRINEVHDASLQGNTSLNAEIKKVLDIGLQMSQEANNLTSALKGDSQQRGAWGEAQLRRTLEMSGLIEEAHYEVQSSFKDSEGRQKQTDYLIKLPDGKHIIIDSKVALNAYDRAVGADSPEEYQLAMNEHVKAVRKHIDDLASKDYTNLVGMRSPSFVLMFMPIEPAYIEALKSKKDLFEYGYQKNIVLVSHTTLIPILRTVSNLWMMERSNSEAREISEKAGEIYNSVCTVAERLSKLGGTLSSASNHYNNTVKALAGQQGLYGKVDRFNQLSTKISKSLPHMEASHMDFETERLSMIVEPIEDRNESLQNLDQSQLVNKIQRDI